MSRICAGSVLSENILSLLNTKTGGQVFVIGTAHVSKESAYQVRQAIREIRPQTVMLELCKKRAQELHKHRTSLRYKSNAFLDVLRERARPYVPETLLPVFNRVLPSSSEIPYGGEILVAMEEATRLKANVVLGDQDHDETMKRLDPLLKSAAQGNADVLSHSPPPPALLSMLAGNMTCSENIEGMKQRSIMRAMNAWMKQSSPDLYRVMVEERDLVLTRALKGCEGERVVGVVGIGHLDGIERNW
eukprot:CAMPEP_0184652764 /NCGR_PEP_ID=MMETSP0308-20130426/10471_1 /TAXON_ID=38269 /ORGANISM="Gloeochaete witrockiana, Strain SAG 46.84" /LENGTH=245 /DNA_ID=CAMNT_0027087837 /DNA_START=167 /DNA_END=901 /DNA_ORIENTATION=+